MDNPSSDLMMVENFRWVRLLKVHATPIPRKHLASDSFGARRGDRRRL